MSLLKSLPPPYKGQLLLVNRKALPSLSGDLKAESLYVVIGWFKIANNYYVNVFPNGRARKFSESGITMEYNSKIFFDVNNDTLSKVLYK